MFTLKNNNSQIFRTRREAGWAAFFEELGIKYVYAENKDFDTTFYLPDMRIHAEVLNEDDQVSAEAIGEWLKGFVGIDKGTPSRPLDDSAVLIDSDPWTKQECKPLGTLTHGDEEPRITSISDKMTGVFMNIGNNHAYVVGRCSKQDHFGGAMISAIDALPVITDEDKKNWSDAIARAKEQVIDMDDIPSETVKPIEKKDPFFEVIDEDKESEVEFAPVNKVEEFAKATAKKEMTPQMPQEPVTEDVFELPKNIDVKPTMLTPFGVVDRKEEPVENEVVEIGENAVIKNFVKYFLISGESFTDVSRVSDLAKYCGKISGCTPKEESLEKELFAQGFPLIKKNGETVVGLTTTSPIFSVRLPLAYEPDTEKFCSTKSLQGILKFICN